MTPAQRTVFEVAHRLGKTLTELGQMPMSEYWQWVRFFTEQAEESQVSSQGAPSTVEAPSLDQMASILGAR